MSGHNVNQFRTSFVADIALIYSKLVYYFQCNSSNMRNKYIFEQLTKTAGFKFALF